MYIIGVCNMLGFGMNIRKKMMYKIDRFFIFLEIGDSGRKWYYIIVVYWILGWIDLVNKNVGYS